MGPPASQVHPDYPPRARIEWVIAGARVVLAVGALFAIWLDPATPSEYETLTYALLVAYLVHSAATLALVWKPIGFSRGWALGGHVFDLGIFSIILILTEGTSSPFYVYFVFSVICGALRWEAKGALLTAAAALAAYALSGGFEVLTNPGFQSDRFVIRMVQLAVIGALLAYVSSVHPGTLREVLRFASWPHLIPHDGTEAVVDIIERANEILPAPQIVLVWQERDEEHVNVAWRGTRGIETSRERRDTYEPVVIASLGSASFQASDASDRAGSVDFWHKGRFRQMTGPPINEALRERFGMRAVQSSPIVGGLVTGRLFWVGRRPMRIDDLVVGDLVARIAASRLESAYLAESHRETAALNERLRVAQDLHDNVLQSLAGSGVQLEIISRVLDRDPRAAKRTIKEVQRQLEQSEREIRGLIKGLRPRARDMTEALNEPLAKRLEAFGDRVGEQWNVTITFQVAPSVNDLPQDLKQQLLLMVQEGVLNAARHANATSVRVMLATHGASIVTEIVDNGKGFDFIGSHDLAALAALDAGPVTLRERITELRGELLIQSSRSGSTVRITLPVAQASI